MEVICNVRNNEHIDGSILSRIEHRAVAIASEIERNVFSHSLNHIHVNCLTIDISTTKIYVDAFMCNSACAVAGGANVRLFYFEIERVGKDAFLCPEIAPLCEVIFKRISSKMKNFMHITYKEIGCYNSSFAYDYLEWQCTLDKFPSTVVASIMKLKPDR